MPASRIDESVCHGDDVGIAICMLPFNPLCSIDLQELLTCRCVNMYVLPIEKALETEPKAFNFTARLPCSSSRHKAKSDSSRGRSFVVRIVYQPARSCRTSFGRCPICERREQSSMSLTFALEMSITTSRQGSLRRRRQAACRVQVLIPFCDNVP